MKPLQRAMERITKEANEMYPANVSNYSQRMNAYSRQAEFTIRELKFEIHKDPSMLEELGVERVSE